jgi:hypothetical protein
LRLLAALAMIPMTAATFAAVGAAWADEPHPKRREGLWEVRSAGSDAVGMPPTLYCVGPRTDTAEAHLDRAAGDRGSCSLGRFVPAGDAWVAESVCGEGRHAVTKRAIASGDFDTEYRIDTIVTRAGGPAGRREDRDAIVARWVGPCESGQRAGDLVIPGMGTLNMEDGTFEAEPPARPARKRQPQRAPK